MGIAVLPSGTSHARRGRGPRVLSRRVEGSAAFSPSDIAGLQHWHKGDGTLWQDSARTTPATVDGDPVGAWDDDSGNARHATQATAGARPTLQTAELNFKSVVRFAGTDDRLTFTGITGFSALSIFAITKRGVTSADQTLISLGKTLIRFDATDLVEWHPDTDTTVINTHSIANTNWHLVSVLQGGTSYDVRLDLVSSAGTTVALDAADRTDALGTFEGGTTWPLTGDIAELIVYDSSLSGANRDAVEGYLLAKYAL